MRNWRIKKKN